MIATYVASELNPGTEPLRLVKWFFSDDPAAQTIRRRQAVFLVPYPNPDGIARDGAAMCPCAGISTQRIVLKEANLYSIHFR